MFRGYEIRGKINTLRDASSNTTCKPVGHRDTNGRFITYKIIELDFWFYRRKWFSVCTNNSAHWILFSRAAGWPSISCSTVSFHYVLGRPSISCQESSQKPLSPVFLYPRAVRDRTSSSFPFFTDACNGRSPLISYILHFFSGVTSIDISDWIDYSCQGYKICLLVDRLLISLACVTMGDR